MAGVRTILRGKIVEASDIKAEMLKRDGAKMLKAAIKQIKKTSKAGYDNTTFLYCRSVMVAELVADELKKLGYDASVGSDNKSKHRYPIKIYWR